MVAGRFWADGDPPPRGVHCAHLMSVAATAAAAPFDIRAP